MSDVETRFEFIADIAGAVDEAQEASIVSRTVFKNDQLRAILFSFAPGESLSEHTSAHPAVLHFLEGEAQVTLGDKSFAAQAGSWASMEARLPHSIEARTAVKMLLLMLG